MFSNLASYLLGYGGAQEIEAPADDMRLTTVETEEDDWLMVETKKDGERSRRSSTTSLPCLSLEESWFVTPPPVFTSTGPVLVETSPLENLLIEHPSMSVYHHRGVGGEPDEDVVSVRSGTSTPLRVRARSLSPRDNLPQRRPRAPLSNLQVTAFQAQKQQSLKESQMLRSKQLERSNKVSNVNKRNKRQRRADRQKNHSGANNNRKCC